MKPSDAPSADALSAQGTIVSPGDGTSLTEDEKVKIGSFSRWHTLPADQPLQSRVHRVGMALVPEYQREMADDNPSKIHFRFYAADYPKMRAEICLLDGVILIPTGVLERLKSDDQLAAVLADGVAYNLQRQAARTVVEFRKELGIAAAEDVAAIVFPPLFLAGLAAGDIPGNNAFVIMQEERGRVALALMADAGYDPWQAPEAWRLLAPKNLPKDVDSLHYPDRSGYQLGILNLQYKMAATVKEGQPAASGSVVSDPR